MKNIALLWVLGFAIAGCGEAKPSQVAVTEIPKGWDYTQTKDELDGTIANMACRYSRVPGEENLTARLCLYAIPEGRVNFLDMDGRDFDCADCKVRIRYDDKVMSVNANKDARNGSIALLLADGDALERGLMVTQIRMATKVGVEVPLAGAPPKVVWFEVSGLDVGKIESAL